MDKLEMAMELIRRAQEEKRRMEAMRKELNAVGWDWAKRNEIAARYSPTPARAFINDSLKMARRLLVEAYE